MKFSYNQKESPTILFAKQKDSLKANIFQFVFFLTLLFVFNIFLTILLFSIPLLKENLIYFILVFLFWIFFIVILIFFVKRLIIYLKLKSIKYLYEEKIVINCKKIRYVKSFTLNRYETIEIIISFYDISNKKYHFVVPKENIIPSFKRLINKEITLYCYKNTNLIKYIEI